MSFLGNGYGYNGNGNGYGGSLLRHLSEHIGETVTIFTTSGGASGCGFSGILIMVNPCFVRLATERGIAPANPLAENICGEEGKGRSFGFEGLSCGGSERREREYPRVGSVCDIPIDKIVSFCHNAV